MNRLTEYVVDLIETELRESNFFVLRNIDVTEIKFKVNSLVSDVLSRMTVKDQEQLALFIRRTHIFQRYIGPYIAKIYADNVVNLNDIPSILEMIYSIYNDIKSFNQDRQNVNIKTDDLIELVGLLLKITLTIIVGKESSELNICLKVIDSAVNLIKLKIDADISISRSFLCCCK